jgi:hypothetical protein
MGLMISITDAGRSPFQLPHPAFVCHSLSTLSHTCHSLLQKYLSSACDSNAFTTYFKHILKYCTLYTSGTTYKSNGDPHTHSLSQFSLSQTRKKTLPTTHLSHFSRSTSFVIVCHKSEKYSDHHPHPRPTPFDVIYGIQQRPKAVLLPTHLILRAVRCNKTDKRNCSNFNL